jgi:hypothetical protein
MTDKATTPQPVDMATRWVFFIITLGAAAVFWGSLVVFGWLSYQGREPTPLVLRLPLGMYCQSYASLVALVIPLFAFTPQTALKLTNEPLVIDGKAFPSCNVSYSLPPFPSGGVYRYKIEVENHPGVFAWFYESLEIVSCTSSGAMPQGTDGKQVPAKLKLALPEQSELLPSNIEEGYLLPDSQE